MRALLDENMPRALVGHLAPEVEARSNRIEDLAPLVPEVKARLGSVAPGVMIRVAV